MSSATTQQQDPDITMVMLQLQKIKRVDMRVALDIAAIANMPVRDGNGNALPVVWARQSVSNEYENATLLTRDALQKHLQTFIDAGVKENIEILQRVEDPAMLVDWVVRTAEYWEKRYAAKRDEKYDISQTVYSAMLEALGLERVRDTLEDKGFKKVHDKLVSNIDNLKRDSKNKYHQLLLKYVSEQHCEIESFFWLHRGFAAVVRFLFRADLISGFRENLCVLAAKMLQKKEVCNKAGSYSSQRQRSDVVTELGAQLRVFLNYLDYLKREDFQKLIDALDTDEWIFLVIDHTALPVTLTHMRTPPICVPDAEMQSCPHCSHVHKLKRRRFGEDEDTA